MNKITTRQEWFSNFDILCVEIVHMDLTDNNL